MPKDFRKKTFTKLLRGYSPEEVDEYLAYINEEYHRLERKNIDSERKLALALKKLDEARALSAERESAEAANIAAKNAENTAENILAQAAVQAEAILAAAKTEADDVYKAAAEMYDEVSSFRDSLFELYNNHIIAVEGIAESAKLYIDKIDGTYSAATGEMVTHDEDAPEDVEIDSDQIDSDEIDEGFSHEDDEDADIEENLLRIDWKNRSAALPEDSRSEDDNPPETRVLDLNLLIEEDEEYAEETEEQFYDDSSYDDPSYDDPSYDDPSYNDPSYDDSGDFEEPNDDVENEFKEMDSLFTVDSGLSLTDEFDIVFANSDSRKNVEEIRRQPMVKPNKPSDDRNKKKQKKF